MKKNKERWIIKAGSSLVAGQNEGLNKSFITRLVAESIELLKEVEIIIVSSGAIAKGISELNLIQRPSSLDLLQASAAVGQMGLINSYQNEFKKYNVKTAQVLISHDDIANRQRYLNSRRSLQTLLKLGVVPIVNENDSVATEEITFGDNDMLAGALVGVVNATALVMLTDQEGVYTSDPRLDRSAELIKKIDLDDTKLNLHSVMQDSSGVLGRGGMKTKIKAAKLALELGAETFIADGRKDGTLRSLLKGKKVGTSIVSKKNGLPGRKQWIASLGSPIGSLKLDKGAEEAIINEGRSLLAVGIKDVSGTFERGALLAVHGPSGKEIARGLSNFSSEEIGKILGLKSELVLKQLGYPVEGEVIHRDNIVLG
tara:strand:+ start:258 stop:1370 length:1113 start_codon:yes stop_codon:yes gene_type:complete